MMKLNKIALLLLCAFMSTGIFAQGERTKEEKEKIEAELSQLKQDYIQLKLDLTEQKLTEFKTLYDKYEAEKRALKKQMKQEKRNLDHRKRMRAEEIENLKEEEALKILKSKLENEKKLLQLEEKYINQFTNTISAKQVLQYKQAEKDFRRELLKMAMEERKESMEARRKVDAKMRARMREMREMKRMKELKE